MRREACPVAGDDPEQYRAVLRQRSTLAPGAHTGHSARVEAVIIGHGEQVATLGNAAPPSGSDPYVGGSFDVTVRAEGLAVTQSVFIFGYSNLGAYFAELADAWRGWPDSKVWESPEGHLKIEATSDGGSHVDLLLTVRNGPVYSWTSSIEIQVEAGEEMAGIARDIEHLLSTTSA